MLEDKISSIFVHKGFTWASSLLSPFYTGFDEQTHSLVSQKKVSQKQTRDLISLFLFLVVFVFFRFEASSDHLVQNMRVVGRDGQVELDHATNFVLTVVVGR